MRQKKQIQKTVKKSRKIKITGDVLWFVMYAIGLSNVLTMNLLHLAIFGYFKNNIAKLVYKDIFMLYITGDMLQFVMNVISLSNDPVIN